MNFEIFNLDLNLLDLIYFFVFNHIFLYSIEFIILFFFYFRSNILRNIKNKQKNHEDYYLYITSQMFTVIHHKLPLKNILKILNKLFVFKLILRH